MKAKELGGGVLVGRSKKVGSGGYSDLRHIEERVGNLCVSEKGDMIRVTILVAQACARIAETPLIFIMSFPVC